MHRLAISARRYKLIIHQHQNKEITVYLNGLIDRIPEEDVELFKKITLLLQSLATSVDVGKPWGTIIPCHILTRAIQMLFPELQVKDGGFENGWDHSWLLTPTGSIIDLNPVATIGGPLLCPPPNSVITPWHRIYRVREIRSGILEHPNL